MELFPITETPIDLHEAVKHFPKSPRGVGRYWRTIGSYILNGHEVNGVLIFLEGKYAADRLCTSVEAIQRFFEKCSAARVAVKPSPATSPRKSSSRAYLESQGMKRKPKRPPTAKAS